ncbi:MAG: TolC family protein [Candidatus Omnitrophica bacterium]|nr:TolC family protein [Candidatus Omnitrophota bacterium]MCM8824918.1 TolC family protein [Candidatus Omnitrophota bacterium]
MKRLTVIAFLMIPIFNSVFGQQQHKKLLLTLEESIKIALENNPDIIASKQKIVQKQWEKEDSKTKFLPVISGSFSYTRLDKSPSISVPGMPLEIEMSKNGIYSASINLTQPVFTGGALSSQYLIKKVELDIAGGEKNLVEQDIVFQVIQTFFSVLKAANFYQAAEILVNQRQAHLANVKKLFEAGLATKADILKAEVTLADAKQKLVETANLMDLAKENLKTVLKLPFEIEISGQDCLARIWPEKELSWWKEAAFKKRDELKQIEKNRSIVELTKKIVQSENYPDVFFILSLKGEKGTSSGLNNWYQNITALVSFNMNIWNWQSTKKRINAIDAQISQIETQKTKISDLISLEITSAYLNLKSAEEKIKVMEKAVEDAQEHVRVTELLRREGLATTTDVIDAQTYLYQSKASYYQALYDYQIAHYQLVKASGQLLDEFRTEK